MKIRILALAAVLAGTANLAGAQVQIPADSYLARVGWTETESPLAAAAAAAAGDIKYEFLNRTDKRPNFSPQDVNARVGKNLDAQLNQNLRLQLQERARQDNAKVGAN